MPGLGSHVALKVRGAFRLSASDIAALDALEFRRISLPADVEILTHKERTSACCAVFSGMVARKKVLPEHRTQIISVSIAGDFPDLQGLFFGVNDSGLWTLTEAEIGLFSHADILRVCEEVPGVAKALWCITLLEGSIARERIASIGRREPTERLAHFLCEMRQRVQVNTGREEPILDLPMSKAQLADTLGLSPVHITRAIAHLRHIGALSELETGFAGDWRRLAEIASFDPAHLNLTTHRHRSQSLVH